MGVVMEDSFPSILRWFLLGIGVVVVVAVYWVSRRGSGRSPSAERKAPTGLSRSDVEQENPERDSVEIEPAATAATADTGDVAFDDAATPGRQIQQWIKRHAGERDEQPARKPGEDSGRAPAAPRATRAAEDNEASGKLLVLHVQAKARRKFVGPEILRVAEQTALDRASGSDGGFFQRRAPDVAAASDDAPLFYMANMFSPGVFRWEEMESFSTSGLSLFAQLPGALPPLETFDELLKCARLFAAKLHGVVLDESRSDLTVQTIQHIKEDLQAYARGRAAPGTIK